MGSTLGIAAGIGATALVAGGLGALGGARSEARREDGFSGRDLGLTAPVIAGGIAFGGVLGLTLRGAMAARGMPVTQSPVTFALLGAAALGSIAASYMTGLSLTN